MHPRDSFTLRLLTWAFPPTTYFETVTYMCIYLDQFTFNEDLNKKRTNF